MLQQVVMNVQLTVVLKLSFKMCNFMSWHYKRTAFSAVQSSFQIGFIQRPKTIYFLGSPLCLTLQNRINCY